ncbi:SPFH domain-containing protein [Aquirhabdus sp.]|uniref:SPFH domain-containing protein n=1 Tax=Aquirhabdus sp. TaxID=2824160 RepID=UPI00396C7799
MSIGSFIRKQFIDVIEWDQQGDDVLMWRYPMQDNEIQNGAQLTVRDGQVAVFVNEGQVADVFTPGLHRLTTQTLPVLTNLKNWDKLFASPFKSDVLFFSTRLQLGRKWGTAQPITLRDKDFDMVRLRAFGMYSYQLVDPKAFYQEVTGANPSYSSDQVEPQLRNLIVSNISSGIAASGIPFLDLAANQGVMGDQLKLALTPLFARYGLRLDAFVVENISLPEDLQKAIDTRISMGMMGDLNKFTQYQVASSIPLAAQNEGGIAGVGAGLAAGFGMGQIMTNALQGATTPAQSASSQPEATPAAPAVDLVARMSQLKALLDQGLITQVDFESTKADILKSLAK